MSWSGRLLPGTATGGGRLAEAVDGLLEQQRGTWPLLAAGYAALPGIETRRLAVRASSVVVQHNPGRLRNTTADVAAAAAGARPCFLCPQGLPPEERGVAFGEDYVVLGNPFPIFDRHLSIVHREHVPQRLSGRVEGLLALAEALGPRYFVLYNGPRCGASAPDHLHFQACAGRPLPVERDPGGAPGEGWVVRAPEDHGRTVVVLAAAGRDRLRRWIEDLVAALPAEDGDEPMLNLVAAAGEEGLTAYLFPRSRHRPAAFYAEGEARLLVSPGAIDMAGVVVVPERRDFERLQGPTLTAIFEEVTLGAAAVRRAAERIGR